MYTPYKLDKTRNLRISTRAHVIIEKTLNLKITKLGQDTLGVHEMMVILWAGLLHEDSALTLEKVIDLVDEHSSLEEAAEKIQEAFEASSSKKK